MPRRLVLVRHAATHPDPSRPAREWPLTPDGERAAEILAAQLAAERAHAVLTSGEPKALATAAPIARALGVERTVDERLGEAERPWLDEGYEDAVAQWLAGDPLAGWEPIDAVRRRVRAALEEREHPLVAVTHGLALTALVTALDPAIDGPRFWRSLAFPDAVVVEDGHAGKLR